MKNKLKKDEGFVQYAFCIMLFAICSLIILYSLRMRIVQQQKQYIEDGITNSALASATIDLNEYGTYNYVRSGSNNFWDEEEDRYLKNFKDALKINLNLDNNLYPNESNTIITSQVRIVNYWIYSKEVQDYVDENGNYVLIRDYNANWVRQHYQTDNWYVLKYQANLDANGMTTGTCAYSREFLGDGIIKTPADVNIITSDAGGGKFGTDGAGSGEIEVDGLTIYATLQFEVNPFGYNDHDTYTDGIFGVGSLVSDTTITKSVVVAIREK